jgi:hypothetical protein
VRWISGSGEFAFFSYGGTARGVIAVGGVAYGVIAVGGIASAGVISIGMNAAGTVAAFGMNAVAPVSISLINGLGILSVAGVNGWGAWVYAGTNAGGMVSHGGVNSDHSILPALLVIIALVVSSFVARGKRASRKDEPFMSIAKFLAAADLGKAAVRARLGSVGKEAVVLVDGRQTLVAPSEAPILARATEIHETLGKQKPPVIVELERTEERVIEGEEVGYRERTHEKTQVRLRCRKIAPAPPPETWLPKDTGEITWVLAWSSRLSAAASIAYFVWALH